ncbi:uncharacterized protein LOC143199035 [Rhynchophorus ferrugineus]|uniref:uncharacterized protein LOC143199035 n=1 Tax=Rhynchophorus ferrugineus TaxID=354439 RepID=UPI003FCD3A04
MDVAKSCPMAFFTPIVEIAEPIGGIQTETKDPTPNNEPRSESDQMEIKHEPPETKNDNTDIIPSGEAPSSNAADMKSEDEDEKNSEPKHQTKDNVTINNKRKRGRPKKNEVSPVKSTESNNKSPKRKQRVPKKNYKETDDVSYEEETLICMDHLDDDKVIKCPICKDDKEWTLTEIRQHYKTEHPKKRLRTSRFFGDTHPCDVCGKEFKSNGSLKDHMETHNNYFYCDICNHSTKKILDHIVHLKIHTGHPGYFKCLMCEFNTMEINKINDHVTHHEDLLKYWCDSCKKSFQILQHFQEHDNYHTGLKPFDCQYCGKCFLYSRYLHAHKMIMHKEEVNCPNTYECVICNKVYQHRNSLKLHMNSHTGNFAICDVCGKTLSSKEKLKFHLRIHTGYKPYSCQYCGKCFTKKPILVEHVRVHTGEKPYVCDYCTKAFSQRSSLVIHMRGHTGEKPYPCQFCFKAFVAKAMLNIHLKTCKGFFHIAKTEL